jgi:hypothetical protein
VPPDNVVLGAALGSLLLDERDTPRSTESNHFFVTKPYFGMSLR